MDFFYDSEIKVFEGKTGLIWCELREIENNLKINFSDPETFNLIFFVSFAFIQSYFFVIFSPF
jgi:hypothetical protein